uniref:Ig-like domain-containing protein n=1 Tax=Pseudonaja textilis TaxID=8673 RepID=A0A670YXZ4_PSETE
ELAESGPAVVRPGDVLNLVCKVTGVSISVSNEWHWMKESPEKGLEWVSAINVHSGNKWYASSVKKRATISADETRNKFYLQINSVISADSYLYFCTRLCTLRKSY